MLIGVGFIAEASDTNKFPRSAYALSCAQLVDFQNISSISISLRSSYGSKKAGTNISDLITLNDKVKLSEMKDFSDSMGQYKLKIDI